MLTTLLEVDGKKKVAGQPAGGPVQRLIIPFSDCQEEVKSGSEILDMDTWDYYKSSKKTKP